MVNQAALQWSVDQSLIKEYRIASQYLQSTTVHNHTVDESQPLRH